MAVDALAIRCPGSVLEVTLNCTTEQGRAVLVLIERGLLRKATATRRAKTDRLLGIQHSFRPRLALIAGAANDLSSPELILPRLGALIGYTRAVEHFVEGQLLDQLRPCIGRGLELFDVVLAVPLVVENLVRYSQMSSNTPLVESGDRTWRWCCPTSSSNLWQLLSTACWTLESTTNFSSLGSGRLEPVASVREGPRSILLAARDARMNSFKRRVGVPSMHECSPRKPETPLSYTMTVGIISSLIHDKTDRAYIGACRKSGCAHHQPTFPKQLPPLSRAPSHQEQPKQLQTR